MALSAIPVLVLTAMIGMSEMERSLLSISNPSVPGLISRITASGLKDRAHRKALSPDVAVITL